MAGTVPFYRVAIIGTGLIGGSFALAIRKQIPSVSLVGYARPDSTRQARERGAIEEAVSDLSSALRGADLVYVALPIGASIEMLPAIAAAAEPHALVTDAGSTKSAIGHVARNYFRTGARFLGGHPMAGKEVSGIEHADAELFRNAPYALIAAEADPDPRVNCFVELVRAIGAQPFWTDDETHDWAVGVVSHLPQLLSVALANVVKDETDETGLPLALAGPGLQDMLRLSGSPYEVWRDIFLTNTENISRALDRLGQAIDHIRTHLATKELESEFHAANELYGLLHKQS